MNDETEGGEAGDLFIFTTELIMYGENDAFYLSPTFPLHLSVAYIQLFPSLFPVDCFFNPSHDHFHVSLLNCVSFAVHFLPLHLFQSHISFHAFSHLLIPSPFPVSWKEREEEHGQKNGELCQSSSKEIRYWRKHWTFRVAL